MYVYNNKKMVIINFYYIDYLQEMKRINPTHRVSRENDIIRKREKEHRHDQLWCETKNYYKHFDQVNTKFDTWTSPRYYNENNQLISEFRMKCVKDELLEKRRKKLKSLLDEEDKSYEIELLVTRSKNMNICRNKLDDIPTEVLKEVDLGLKIEEDDRRKHEAELNLYHKWRANNPIIRQYESINRNKNLKLSWLDQQIEKRMRKEKEEEDCRRILKEREEMLKKQKEMDEEFRKKLEEKNMSLKNQLEEQITELKEKLKLSENLKKEEDKEMCKRLELRNLEEQQQQEEKRRINKEYALFNIRQYKLKLKQKMCDIEENLRQEEEFILKLKKLELQDAMDDELKREEFKNNLDEFLHLVKQQQELEKQRQKHFEFIFESESKSIYDRQSELWQLEQNAREKLMKNVMAVVKDQIQFNLERNREKQQYVLKEREEMTQKIEMLNKELTELKEKEIEQKMEKKKIREEDIRLKTARKVYQENFKLKEINDELERVQKEEERLKHEIMNIQRRQEPIRPVRSRILF